MIAATARTELREPVTMAPAGLDVAEHLAAILADLQDRGVTVTTLNVIAYATDMGLPEPVVIAVAALLEVRP